MRRGRFVLTLHALGWTLSAALLVLPPALGIAASTGAGDWRRHATFDGVTYRLGAGDAIAAELDPSGSAAVLATFERWVDGSGSEAAAFTRFIDAGGDAEAFAQVAAPLGAGGRWFDADAAALPRLKVPFVAAMRDGRMVIVRRVAIGYVHAADPTRGSTLTPSSRFVADWSGRVFAFTEPPPLPGGWP